MPKHEEKTNDDQDKKGTEKKKKQKHETLIKLVPVYCTYLSFVLIQYFLTHQLLSCIDL